LNFNQNRYGISYIYCLMEIEPALVFSLVFFFLLDILILFFVFLVVYQSFDVVNIFCEFHYLGMHGMMGCIF
jgi:hypothetical protein